MRVCLRSGAGELLPVQRWDPLQSHGKAAGLQRAGGWWESHGVARKPRDKEDHSDAG